ncbi:MAG: hypothetical protein SOY12_06630 [Schaedlerella sp.]|nr:hypothetical protein [Schaedlerella sp.]
MNPISKTFCRTYQFAFHAALPLLPYREPKIFNSIDSLASLLNQLHVHSVLLVTDPVLKSSGITAPTRSAFEG